MRIILINENLDLKNKKEIKFNFKLNKIYIFDKVSGRRLV